MCKQKINCKLIRYYVYPAYLIAQINNGHDSYISTTEQNLWAKQTSVPLPPCLLFLVRGMISEISGDKRKDFRGKSRGGII